MFNTTKNSKNLGLAFMLCIASLLVDCSSGGGGGGGGTGPGVATCRNGLGAVGACESCDTGFQLSGGLCNPIPGAPCADGSGSAGACTSCNTGFVLAENSCFAQVTVSFNLNGGIGNSPSNQTIRAGESVTVPGIGGATLDGFTFIGWSTLRTNAGANFVRAGNTYIIPAVRVPQTTLTLYATWAAPYTVTYNLNGGMGSAPNASVALAGTEVTLRALTLTGSNNNNRPANASASPNNGFLGWGVNADGSGQTYNTETNQVFASDTTLYALWYYSITYNCSEGTASGSFPTRTTVRTGEVLTNLPLTGCNGNILGWSTTGNIPYITTMPNGPITLKAVYQIVDADGDGLIEISTAEQLNNMRYNLAGTSWKTNASDAGSSGGCPSTGCRGYELTADIDLGNTKWGTSASFVGTRVTAGWEPIGACSADSDCTDATDTPFTATFEGRGFVIRNLYINRPTNLNETGLFGASTGTLNQVALVNVAVRGNIYTGGLVGQQDDSNSSITSSYATGAVSGIGDVGGLVGLLFTGSITSSYVTGVVLGSSDNTGGLVGSQFGGSITSSYAMGAVTGSDRVSGLVGQQADGTITSSYAMGAVTGSSSVGGLVGVQFGSITSSYATEAVMGSSDVGGLVGSQFGGSITSSYATGAVTGTSNVGGLVGNQPTGTITTSYWNSMSTQTLSGTARSEADRLGIGNVATSTLTSTANGVSALSTTLLQSNMNAAGATILATSAFYVVAGSYPKLCVNPLPAAAVGVCSATYRLAGQD